MTFLADLFRRTSILQFGFIVLLLTTSCATRPSESWQKQYSYLKRPLPRDNAFTETDYYVVLLVSARHLNYLDQKELTKTLIKRARGILKSDVGHSWVYLRGIKNDRRFVLEGGHSGEVGKDQPRLFDGVMNYMEYGYADPTESQKANPRYEPNPIKYLWADLHDGFFQKGSGGFRPTFAAKVDLTKEKFEQILVFMDPQNYPYQRFSLVEGQCSSFVAEIASMAGLPLEHHVTIEIESVLSIGKRQYRLWSDPEYSKIIFSAPDVLERSLMEAVADGRAQYALDWYLDERRLR